MRFFFLTEAPPDLEGEWLPPGELSRHLKALRLGPEQEFLLMLPLGGAVRASWDGRRNVRLHGLTEVPRLELLPVTVATAWPKGSRVDQLVARATEAGVERILPLRCERSVAGTTRLSEQRMQRWDKLARKTCEQVGRPFPPILERDPVDLFGALAEAPTAYPIALVPGKWPLTMELNLKVPREVLLLIGPEGGFSPEEVEWLGAHEVHLAGLLPTILRIESAGAVAAAICQHWYLERRGR